MALTAEDERDFLALVLYQVDKNSRYNNGLNVTEFGNIDYSSVKEVLMGLSYMDANGYRDSPFDTNNNLDYIKYASAPSYNLYEDLNRYQINNPIITIDANLKDKINENLNYIKVLDNAIKNPRFGRKDKDLLALISKRSNCLFKGISHRTIPINLLDSNGVIKEDSEILIPFYNSTTTNFALGLLFAFFFQTDNITNPTFTGTMAIPDNTLIGGTNPTKEEVQNEIKQYLKSIKYRNLTDIPKKLINFINDDIYVSTQEKLNTIVEQTNNKGGYRKKGGAYTLFRDSGHFFIINDLDPNLFAFDYFDYMVNGDPNLKDKYIDQDAFLKEQEILFDRLTKFTNIKFIGAISDTNANCMGVGGLADGEILLCLDGCLYNNRGKIACSTHLLGRNGLQNITGVYGTDSTTFGHHAGLNTDLVIGLKVYTCKLESIIPSAPYLTQIPAPVPQVPSAPTVSFNRASVSQLPAPTPQLPSAPQLPPNVSFNRASVSQLPAPTPHVPSAPYFTQIPAPAPQVPPTVSFNRASVSRGPMPSPQVPAPRRSIRQFPSAPIIIYNKNILIDKNNINVKLITTNDILIINNNINQADKTIKIKELTEKAIRKANLLKQPIQRIMSFLSDCIGTVEDVITKTPATIYNFADKCINGMKDFQLFGGVKLNKTSLIEKILKITPDFKGLSKMKKENLLITYTKLNNLNKYKKEELIKKYKIKDKNLKKNEIIHHIFNSS